MNKHLNSVLALASVLGALSLGTAHAETGTTNIISGTVVDNAGTNYYVGNTGPGNYLEINSGGRFTNCALFGIGWNTGANSNNAVVTGSGSLCQATNAFYLGNGGAGNSLTISNGGVLTNAGYAYFGVNASAGNNTALVTGSGSQWQNRQNINLGWGGVGNSLTISNGGTVTSGGACYLGYNAGSSSNTATITGAGSVWNLNGQDLTVGNNAAATNNVLNLGNGGLLAAGAGHLIVGNGVNGLVNLGDGTALATANVRYLQIQNGSGRVNINAGVIKATGNTSFLLTGYSSYFVRSGGVVIDDSGYAVTTPSGLQQDSTSPGGGLTKIGAGTLTLAGGSTFTGSITISNGTLTIGSAAQLGGGTYSALITNYSALNYNSSAAQTLSGVISGSGALTTSGSGTLTLSGANTYTGPTIINAGLLKVVNNSALGTGTVTVNGGTLASTNSAYTLANKFVIGGNFQLGGQGQPIVLSGSMDLGGATRTITVSNAAYLNGAVTNGGLTVAGSSFLQLSSANTYSGNTTISSGKLILTGSINNTPTISIAAGATFDVSSYPTYTLSSSTTLAASGTGTSAGTTAAAVKGGSSGTVALGTRPVTLNYTPTAFTGDSTHQSLYISQGALTVSSPVTVINKAATALGAGTYTIATSAGAMSGSPTLVGVFGTGLASGCKASVSITTPDLLLTVASGATTTTTTLTRHTGTGTSTTYGDSLSFDVAVSPSAATGTVLLMDGGTVIGSGTLSGGSCTITPTVNALAAGTHSAITAAYGGDGTYGTSVSSALSSQTVAAKALTITAPTVTKVYDGGTTAGTVTVGTLSGFVGSETVTATGTATAYSAKDVGSAYASTVSYTLANGTGGGLAANYSLANSVIANAAITAKSLGITSPTVTKIYDGGTTAGAVTVGTLSGFVGSETVTATGTATAYSAKDVGSAYANTVSYTLANGANGGLAANYSLGNSSITTAAITARPLTFTGSKTYDGSATATAVQLTFGNNMDGANLTMSGSVTLASANAGAPSINSFGGLTLGGSAAGNYTLTGASGSVTINPKAASVTADAKTKTYGDVNPALTAVTNGTVNGDLLNYTLATDATQFSSVGVSNITVTLGSNPNYSVSATNSTLTINQATTFVGANSTNNPCGYKDAVAFVATLPSDATGSVVFSSTNGPISTNALSGGSATSLSITNLPRGTNVITVTYFGDGNYLGSTNSTLEQIVTNHPPVAKAITNGAPAGVTNVIRLIGGKPHLAPTDADGDALLVSQVQNPSALLSATVTTDGTNILYTPGLNASGADTVQYVVSDGYGGSSTNAMYVTVTGQSFNIISGPTLANNQFQVTFAGIPERAYLVDDSTNSATGPWAFYTNLTAGTNGLFQLVATNDPPAVMRFFRTRPAP